MNNKVLITEAREFVLNSDDCEYGELLMWMADALEKSEGENEALSQCIEKLKKQNERLIWRGWISVGERLPEYTGDYNTVCDVGSMLGGFKTVRTYRFEHIQGQEPKWCIMSHYDEIVTITHWRELPEPPTDEVK